MIKLPRNPKQNTIDFREVLSMSPSDRISFARSPEGLSFLASLSATQYAKLFPDYYRRQLPDIGQAMSTSRGNGRSWPPSGFGNNESPTPGSGRRTGNGYTPPNSPASPPDSPYRPPSTAPSRQQSTSDNNDIWKGGTPLVNRGGELPKKFSGNIDRSSFDSQMADPSVRAAVLARMKIEVGNQGPNAQQMWLESVFNRAASRNKTLLQAVNNHDGYYPRKDDSKWASLARSKPVSAHEAILERVHKEGTDISNGATGNSSLYVGFGQGTGRKIRTKEESEKTGVPIGGIWAPGQTATAGGERFGREKPDIKWTPPRIKSDEEYLPPLELLNPKAFQRQTPASPAQTSSRAPTNQPAAGSFSSVIARYESGSRGYNAYNKGTARQGTEHIDFSQLTLGEVMQKQRNRELFAVGKYQIITNTLQSAVDTLKLDKNEKFTPELQDRIFAQYLAGPGKRPEIDKYIRGNGSLSAAHLAAAQEWAGLAHPDTGRSNYGGSNSAPDNRTEVRQALENAKRIYNELISKGVDPDKAYLQALNGTGPSSPPVAQSKKPPIGYGDSVMNQILQKHGTIERGYARDSAPPKEILEKIKAQDPASFRGREVFLSTGLLNNTQDAATVREMIKYVKDNGGNVTIVGGPMEDKARKDVSGVHRNLEQIATEMGVKITSPYSPSQDGVHVSNKFLDKMIPAVTPVQNSGIPLSYGVGIVGNEKISDKDNEKRPTYMPGRISFEGFEDDKLKTTSFIAGSGGQEAYPSVPYGTYSLSPQRTGNVISNYYSRGGLDSSKGAFSKVFNVGRPGDITGTGYDPKVGRQRREIQIHSNIRNDINRLVSSGCLTVTPGEYPKLVTSIERAMELSGGNVSLVVENDGNGGARYKIIPSSMSVNPMTVSEAIQEQGTAPAVPVQTSPIPQEKNNQEPYKLMFNASRAYTEPEVQDMVKKYGKNLIIGANMDDPKEYDQVKALSEKYNLRMHGYSMGRGAPQSGWGGSYPAEQKAIREKAMAMGISVDQWYSGGWMDYEIERLKKLGPKAPAQMEFDNINDTKDDESLRQELLKFDAFRRESGIKTQMVPKNFGEREYRVYNKLLEEKKIAPDLAVPLNIVESQYFKGDKIKKPTAEAGHAYGDMPKENVKEYKTDEPLTQPVQAAGKEVKQNKYGGELRTRNSKEDTFLVNARGVLGSIGPGETVDFQKDGRIDVIPNNRTNPNQLVEQSTQLLSNLDSDAQQETQSNMASLQSDSRNVPTYFEPAIWNAKQGETVDMRVFNSVSFERSCRASKFDKSGDSGLNGHFDSFSTNIS